jgi:hypothetical protein
VNNTTGAFTITARTASGTGVVLAAGQQKITGDGTNITQPAESIAPATQNGHAVNLGQFASSLSANDYLKLPNGWIIQWGTISNTAGGNSSGVFPLSFPKNCFSIVLTGLQASGGVQAYATLNSKTNNGFIWNAFTANGGSAPIVAGVNGQVQGFFNAIGN